MNRMALIVALAFTLVGCAASGPREIKIVADENGFTPKTVTVKKGNSTTYRARFSGFSEDEAKAACRAIEKQKAECYVLGPAS